MSRRLLSAATTTLAVRVVSAVLSFLVFAQVAAALPAPAAARVLFFSFVFGFALATLRCFHLVSAAITGAESRSARWRRVRRAARATQLVALVLAPVTALLLHAQGVHWGVAAAGAALTVVCAVDFDLGRAVLQRLPLLPLLTALGGMLGCALLLAVPQPGATVCALAFLLQWLPVAAQQLVQGRRLLRRLPRHRGAVRKPSWSDTASSLLLAVFDGAVLNAAFVLALPLPAAAALDLALGNRLFVASLALFSLVASWVVSGDLARLARRLGLSTPLAFIAMQSGCGLVLGGLYALMYAGVAEHSVSAAALGVFVLLLLAYTCHAASIRFGALLAPVTLRLAAYGLTLAGFYALMLTPQTRSAPQLAIIVAATVLALLLPAGLMLIVGRSLLRRR